MKSINLLGAAAALFIAATPAFAAEWIPVFIDTKNAIYYYDIETIRRSRNVVTVWEKRDHSRDRTVKYREVKAKRSYNCSARTSILLSVIVYYPNGKVESEEFPDYAQTTESVAPDTSGEDILEAVCSVTAP
jgi:hypothetical protein